MFGGFGILADLVFLSGNSYSLGDFGVNLTLLVLVLGLFIFFVFCMLFCV